MAKNNPTIRVGKRLDKIISEGSKQLGTPKTVTSNLLADFAKAMGFPPKKKMKKKGTVMDTLPTMVTALTFAIAILVGFTLLNDFANQGAFNQSTQSQTFIESARDNYILFDNLFLAAFLGLALTSVISAAFVRTSPLFFAISVVLLIIVLTISGVVSNSFDAMSGSALDHRTVFPKLYFVMDNLMLFILIEAIMILVALYSVRGVQV